MDHHLCKERRQNRVVFFRRAANGTGPILTSSLFKHGFQFEESGRAKLGSALLLHNVNETITESAVKSARCPIMVFSMDTQGKLTWHYDDLPHRESRFVIDVGVAYILASPSVVSSPLPCSPKLEHEL